MSTTATTTSETANPGNRTYGQILKSSAVIGGSSAINIGLGFFRTKVMAVLLDPAGIGLFGVYWSILDLVRSIAGMGINTSGVRQIAESAQSGDAARLARTVTTLRRVALILGAIGAVALVALARPISWFSFDDFDHASAIAWLALAGLFYDVSAGQGAVIQGMRRVGDLARMNIWGGIFGTLFGIAVVYYFYKQGEPQRGVAPSMVCVAVMAILTSWWYARRIKVERVRMTMADVSTEVSGLLKLGFVFMLATLMTLAVAYLVRVMLVRELGKDAAGYYQAAWMLGGMAVASILQAMGADFYPRLTAVASDNPACNRLVNEQAEIGLLIAGPGVLGTLTFAPVVIAIQYSAKFGPAVELLRWICLGMMMRVASWPMGFILGAKGIRSKIFWSELAASVSQIGFAWLGVHWFGLKGAGIGFFASYVFYWFLIYFIVRSVSGFRWTTANKKIGLLYGVLITGVFVSWYCLPRWLEAVIGTAITIGAGIFSLRTVVALVSVDRLPRSVQRIIRLLKLTPPAAA